jgi:hypothetical protein
MTEYKVIWEMDIEAGSPREAAEQARAAQARPGTWAVVFDVGDPDGVITRVDLLADVSEDYILWPGDKPAHNQHMQSRPQDCNRRPPAPAELPTTLTLTDEEWLAIREALARVERGQVVDLGNFTQHADDNSEPDGEPPATQAEARDALTIMRSAQRRKDTP